MFFFQIKKEPDRFNPLFVRFYATYLKWSIIIYSIYAIKIANTGHNVHMSKNLYF